MIDILLETVQSMAQQWAMIMVRVIVIYTTAQNIPDLWRDTFFIPQNDTPRVTEKKNVWEDENFCS